MMDVNMEATGVEQAVKRMRLFVIDDEPILSREK